MTVIKTHYKTSRFNTVHNKYHGGFIMYWRLFKSLIQTILWFYGVIKSLHSVTYDINITDEFRISRKARIIFFLMFAIKTPYWLLIKPLAWLIVIRTHYKGKVFYVNGEIDYFEELEKYVTIKLRRIPLIKFPWFYTQKDLDYITK